MYDLDRARAHLQVEEPSKTTSTDLALMLLAGIVGGLAWNITSSTSERVPDLGFPILVQDVPRDDGPVREDNFRAIGGPFGT